jgi:hypothetical protein
MVKTIPNSTATRSGAIQKALQISYFFTVLTYQYIEDKEIVVFLGLSRLAKYLS